MKRGRLDVLALDVSAKRLQLIVLEAYEDPSVTWPVFCRSFGLVENELEAEQADLKDERTTALFIIPIQRKAQGVGVIVERALRIADKEDCSCVKVFQGSNLNR